MKKRKRKKQRTMSMSSIILPAEEKELGIERKSNDGLDKAHPTATVNLYV